MSLFRKKKQQEKRFELIPGYYLVLSTYDEITKKKAKRILLKTQKEDKLNLLGTIFAFEFNTTCSIVYDKENSSKVLIYLFNK